MGKILDKRKRQAIERGVKAKIDKRHKAADPQGKAVIKSTPFEEVTEQSAETVEPKPEIRVKVEPKEGALPKLPKLPSATRVRKDKPVHECSCGCGGQTYSQWVPGHDARARGWAIRIERGVCGMGDIPENERAGAKLMLDTRSGLVKAGLAPKSNIKLVGKVTEPVAESTEPEAPAAVNE